jgi:hypothetical protein
MASRRAWCLGVCTGWTWDACVHRVGGRVVRRSPPRAVPGGCGAARGDAGCSLGCLGGGGLRAGLVGIMAGCAMAGCRAQRWPARGSGRPGGVQRLRVTGRVCIGGGAARWLVHSTLCLVLWLCRAVVSYGVLCCSGWLTVCPGAVAPVVCAFALHCCAIVCSPIFGVTLL